MGGYVGVLLLVIVVRGRLEIALTACGTACVGTVLVHVGTG
jgi:hypothetical protein